MLLIICDVFTTFLQSFLIAWACHNITAKENRISKAKSALLTVMISTLTMTFTYSKLEASLSNLFISLGNLTILIIFYRKSIKDALLSFGLIYAMFDVCSFFILTVYGKVIVKINFKISTDLQKMIFIFIPVWIIYSFVLIFRAPVLNILAKVKNHTKSIIFIIIFIYIIIALDIKGMQFENTNLAMIIKLMHYILLFMLFLYSIVYFAKIHEKSKERELLNIALNEKITELRKMKHDYGSEISGLYGLYEMGRIDRLGEMLKNIVDRNQALNTSIYVTIEATPLVKSVFNSIKESNIDLIVSDEADYEDISITDEELFKLISNIVRNSVDALKNTHNPIIKFKSYNLYDAVLINISNNGPEIPKEIRNKIFNDGFTTKDNTNCERGYGLSIVKDIIDKCNGRITIDSNKEMTQFYFEIPYEKYEEII